MRAASRKLIVVAALLPAAILMAGASRPPTAPGLSLSPSMGIPGTTVSARGSDFTPGMDVSLLWDGSFEVGQGVVGATGGVVISFRVPGSAAPGGHTVVLCALCGQDFETAKARFEALPAPTATSTCEQMLSCTWTPTHTSAPTSTPTPTASLSPTPLGFVASVTPSATPPATEIPTPASTAVPTLTPTVTGPRPTVLLLLCAGALLIAGSGVGLIVILLRRRV